MYNQPLYQAFLASVTTMPLATLGETENHDKNCSVEPFHRCQNRIASSSRWKSLTQSKCTLRRAGSWEPFLEVAACNAGRFLKLREKMNPSMRASVGLEPGRDVAYFKTVNCKQGCWQGFLYLYREKCILKSKEHPYPCPHGVMTGV